MKTASMDNSTTNDGTLKPRPRAAGGPLDWWGRARNFLTDVRAELRRVTWPTRPEVIATTWVVVLFSTAVGIYLWGLDLFFGRLVNWAFQALGAA